MRTIYAGKLGGIEGMIRRSLAFRGYGYWRNLPSLKLRRDRPAFAMRATAGPAFAMRATAGPAFAMRATAGKGANIFPAFVFSLVILPLN